MNEKLKEIDQIKSDYLDFVAHDLMTPMTSILGLLDLVKRRIEKMVPLIKTNTKN